MSMRPLKTICISTSMLLFGSLTGLVSLLYPLKISAKTHASGLSQVLLAFFWISLCVVFGTSVLLVSDVMASAAWMTTVVASVKLFSVFVGSVALCLVLAFVFESIGVFLVEVACVAIFAVGVASVTLFSDVGAPLALFAVVGARVTLFSVVKLPTNVLKNILQIWLN